MEAVCLLINHFRDHLYLHWIVQQLSRLSNTVNERDEMTNLKVDKNGDFTSSQLWQIMLKLDVVNSSLFCFCFHLVLHKASATARSWLRQWNRWKSSWLRSNMIYIMRKVFTSIVRTAQLYVLLLYNISHNCIRGGRNWSPPAMIFLVCSHIYVFFIFNVCVIGPRSV